MTQRLSLTVAAISMAACVAGARPIVMADQSILRRVSSYESTWAESRTPLAFTAGQASDCGSYERLKGSGVVEGVANDMVKSEYLICDALGVVGTSVELKTMQADENYGEALVSRLDLRTFPSSLGPRLEDDRYTLAALFNASELKTTSTGVAVSDATWSYVLSVMLVGDFDRNGSVDWLLWLTDEAIEGNYRGYQSCSSRTCRVPAYLPRPHYNARSDLLRENGRRSVLGSE